MRRNIPIREEISHGLIWGEHTVSFPLRTGVTFAVYIATHTITHTHTHTIFSFTVCHKCKRPEL